MCNLETEGTKYGCGHYKVTNKTRKIDCNNPYCALSVRHNDNCDDCRCDKFHGPDAREVITLTTQEYCVHCQYWFRGPGSVPRR